MPTASPTLKVVVVPSAIATMWPALVRTTKRLAPGSRTGVRQRRLTLRVLQQAAALAASASRPSCDDSIVRHAMKG